MSQSSLFWTTGSTGDGASAYTQTQLLSFFARMFLGDYTSQGVIATYQPQFSISGSSSPITIGAGAAVVYGIPYLSDASVNLSVTTPTTGTTGYLVVLQANYSAQTVRLALHANTDGNSAIPLPTQTAGTTWEVPLWSFTITTGGVISAATDKRKFISPGRANFFGVGTFGSSLIINADNSSNVAPGTYSITFAQPYASGVTPIVLVTAVATSGGVANDGNVYVTNVTNTGFTYQNSASAGVFTRVHYLAIGPQ